MKFLIDFLPIVLFFVAYKMHDIYAATAVLIVAAAVQNIVHYTMHKRFDNMHLMVLGLTIVFGGMTLLLRDPMFVMWKPTIVNWLFALVFAGSHFIGEKTILERMMRMAEIDVPQKTFRNVSWAWVGFFIFSGLVNLYVAYNYDENTWVNFKLFGMLGLTLVFVITQSIYLSLVMQKNQQQES